MCGSLALSCRGIAGSSHGWRGIAGLYTHSLSRTFSLTEQNNFHWFRFTGRHKWGSDSDGQVYIRRKKLCLKSVWNVQQQSMCCLDDSYSFEQNICVPNSHRSNQIRMSCISIAFASSNRLTLFSYKRVNEPTSVMFLVLGSVQSYSTRKLHSLPPVRILPITFLNHC